MEEAAAHALYTEFSAVDAGARFKQGIGFAGRGAYAKPAGLQGYDETRDDDDIIARNRRLQGREGQRDDGDEDGYDSDTAEAVTRRLKQLKQQQLKQKQSQGAAADEAALPERLYDERRERLVRQQQQRQQREELEQRQQRQQQRDQRQPDRRRSRSCSRGRGLPAEQQQRSERHGSKRRSGSRSRERRHRSRSREKRRRSRSRERRHRSRSREKRHRSRSREKRQRSRSRSRARQQGGVAAGPSGLQKLNFEALIPGYGAMNPAQRLKAKTQFLLERNAAKDQQRAKAPGAPGEQQQQWRFRFDANAELEEDRRPPAPTGRLGMDDEDGDDEHAARLDSFNAVTFGQSNAAAVQQERDQSHEAAIFGGGGTSRGAAATASTGKHGPGARAVPQPAAGLRHRDEEGPLSSKWRAGSSRLEASDGAAAEGLGSLLPLEEAEGAVIVSAAELASATAVPGGAAMPRAAPGSGAGSWRERALAARHAKLLDL